MRILIRVKHYVQIALRRMMILAVNQDLMPRKISLGGGGQ